jgi:hypothetical protein
VKPQLKPFAKGNDPRRNTTGIRKAGINLADMVRRIAAEPVSKDEKMMKMEAVIRATFAAAFRGDMKAVEFLADRGWGKATQPIENVGSEPLVVVLPLEACGQGA